MSRKIIGITCATMPREGLTSARNALNRPYAWAIERAGGVPVLLPATQCIEHVERYLSILDGLLLSGGVDVDPACYGHDRHPRLGAIDPDRDAIEIPLARRALEMDMPLFAICRGIQTLNVAMGGTLYQDLPSEFPNAMLHQQNLRQIPRDRATHSIRIDPDSRLAEIVGALEMDVNTFHHQALLQVAEPLRITAYAPDGVIEAAESLEHRYVLGVQFHPEETAPNDPKSRRLFEAFVAAT